MSPPLARRSREWKRVSFEVRVLDQSHQIAKWVGYGSDANALAHVLHRGLEERSSFHEVCDRRIDPRDTPKRHRSARSRFHTFDIGIQAELEAADVEAHVKRLVEVGFGFKRCAIPLLGTLEIGNVIDHGTQTEDHYGEPFGSRGTNRTRRRISRQDSVRRT